MESTNDCVAVFVAAWANEMVYMCEKHMDQLYTIGNAMGCPIQPRLYFGDEKCKNCENEKDKSQAPCRVVTEYLSNAASTLLEKINNKEEEGKHSTKG